MRRLFILLLSAFIFIGQSLAYNPYALDQSALDPYDNMTTKQKNIIIKFDEGITPLIINKKINKEKLTKALDVIVEKKWSSRELYGIMKYLNQWYKILWLCTITDTSDINWKADDFMSLLFQQTKKPANQDIVEIINHDWWKTIMINWIENKKYDYVHAFVKNSLGKWTAFVAMRKWTWYVNVEWKEQKLYMSGVNPDKLSLPYYNWKDFYILSDSKILIKNNKTVTIQMTWIWLILNTEISPSWKTLLVFTIDRSDELKTGIFSADWKRIWPSGHSIPPVFYEWSWAFTLVRAKPWRQYNEWIYYNLSCPLL